MPEIKFTTHTYPWGSYQVPAAVEQAADLAKTAEQRALDAINHFYASQMQPDGALRLYFMNSNPPSPADGDLWVHNYVHKRYSALFGPDPRQNLFVDQALQDVDLPHHYVQAGSKEAYGELEFEDRPSVRYTVTSTSTQFRAGILYTPAVTGAHTISFSLRSTKKANLRSFTLHLADQEVPVLLASADTPGRVSITAELEEGVEYQCYVTPGEGEEVLAGDVVFIGAVLVELGEEALPFFDGNSPASSWMGTEGNSISVYAPAWLEDTTGGVAAIAAVVEESHYVDGYVDIFVGEEPGFPEAGDLWDDDLENLWRWTGSQWIPLVDANSPSIIAQLNQQAQQIANALAQLVQIEDRLDGVVEIYYSPTAPANPQLGDLWFDLSNGRLLKRWDGDSWEEVSDERIAELLEEVDSKITTYWQNSEPTGGTYTVGDLWFETDQNNKPHRWNGSAWVDISDTRVDQLYNETIRSVEIEYSVSISDTTPPVTGWSTDTPERNPGEYIWFRTKITYADDTVVYTSPAPLTGNTGPEGPQGVPGPPGNDGQSLYTWVKYADDDSGTGMSDDPTGKEYIGLAYNKTSPAESSNPADYQWYLFKGPQGDQGVPGPPGEDGQPTYTWIKYADDSSGGGMSDDPTGKTYMGVAYNKTTPTESTNPADYSWALIKGADGAPAPTVHLTSTGHVLISPPSGTGATTPASVEVTAAVTGTTITGWQFAINGGSFSGTVPAGVTGSGSSRTVTGSTMTADTIALRVNTAAGVSDTLTIAKVKEGEPGDPGAPGADAITVVLTNEAHTFPGDVNNALAGSTKTYVKAWKGATPQNINVTGVNVNGVTGISASVTAGNNTTSPEITISVNTSLTTQSGQIDITCTIDGKTITKAFTWSVSRKGSQGIQGPPGADGTSLYTWIKYANDASGTGMSDSPAGKTYMGIAYNKTSPTESSNPADYEWSLIKGDQGIQGPPGADGQPTYTWVKYADNASGGGLSDDPTGKKYIGLAYNKTTPTESTNPADYQWALIQGEDGVSVVSITPYWAQVAANASAPALPTTSPPPAPWTSTEPPYAPGTALYRTERIIYSAGSPNFAYTTVVRVSSYDGVDSARGESWSNDGDSLVGVVARSGTLPAITSVTDASGGYVLRSTSVNSHSVFTTGRMAYDPNKLYKVSAKIRRVTGTDGLYYLGLEGLAADGTTLVNTTGADSSTSQHFVAAAYATPPANGTWVVVKGYVKGHGGTGTATACPDPTAPGVMHTNVRYIQPVAILNYTGTSGNQWELDWIKLEVADQDADIADIEDRINTGDIAQAISTANGRLTTSASAPSPLTDSHGKPVGAIWYLEDFSQAWRWTGTVWTPIELSFGTQFLPFVDIMQATVGELDGIRIKANSVETSKLRVGDFAILLHNPNTEMTGDPLILTGWETLSGLQAVGVAVTDHPVNGGDGHVHQVTANGTLLRTFNTRWVEAEPGDEFRFGMWFRRVSGTSTGSIVWGVQWQRADGSTGFDSADTSWLSSAFPNGVWTWREAKLKLPTSGSPIRRVRFWWGPSSTVLNGVFQGTGFVFRRHVPAVEIGDGAVHADLELATDGSLRVGATNAPHILMSGVVGLDYRIPTPEPEAPNATRTVVKIGGAQKPQFLTYGDDNNELAGVAADGTVFGPEGAFDVLTIGGDDFNDIVRVGRSEPIVWSGYHNTTYGPITKRHGLHEFRFDAKAGHIYRITVRASAIAASASQPIMGLLYRTAALGTNPGTITVANGTEYQHAASFVVRAANAEDTRSITWVYEPTTDLSTAWLVFVQPQPSTTIATTFRRWSVIVDDVGPTPENTGNPSSGGVQEDGGGAGSPTTPEPTPVQVVRTWDFSAHASYSQHGYNSSYNPSWLRSGTGGTSHYRGYLRLPTAARDFLLSSNTVSVSKIEVFLASVSGYQSSIPLASHNSSALPTDGTGPARFNVTTTGVPTFKQGEKKWFTLPAAIRDALRTGHWGIVVGTTTSHPHHSFYGTGAGNSLRPKVRITAKVKP